MYTYKFYLAWEHAKKRTLAMFYSPRISRHPQVDSSLRALAKPTSQDVHRVKLWNEELPSDLLTISLLLFFSHIVCEAQVTLMTVAGKFEHISFTWTFSYFWAIAFQSFRHSCHLYLLHSFPHHVALLVLHNPWVTLTRPNMAYS